MAPPAAGAAPPCQKSERSNRATTVQEQVEQECAERRDAPSSPLKVLVRRLTPVEAIRDCDKIDKCSGACCWYQLQ